MRSNRATKTLVVLNVLAACALAQADESAAALETDHRRLMYWVDEQGHEHPVNTAEDWSKRRSHILQGMQQAMGPLPVRRNLPKVRIETTHTVDKGFYSRQTIHFQAHPDSDRITAYLYLPHRSVEGQRGPAMLVLHQTNALGKGDVDEEHGRENRIFASELAQRGYVVLAPDYPSFGDLKDYDFAADNYVSGTMKGIVNHMRCVDLLREHPMVDPQRIGVLGHSLGGHNAMFLAVFDERIKLIVSSCGWTPFHDYYGGKIAGWTSERYMPRLRDVYGLDPDKVPFDFYEVVAALAPRPFFSNSPLYDDNFDHKGVLKVTEEARKVYRLLGAEDKFQLVSPDSGHDFPFLLRQEAYEWIHALMKPIPGHGVITE